MIVKAFVLYCLLNFSIVNGEKVYVLPLQGDLTQLFMYYATIQVGTPGNKFTVVIDTGSADFLIPDITCTNCYGGNPKYYYNATASTTSSEVLCNGSGLKCTKCSNSGQCGYAMKYVGIEEDALVYKDVARIEDVSVPIYLGAIYNVSFGFEERFNMLAAKKLKVRQVAGMDYPEGMFGLGYSKLNSLGATPLFDSMVQHNMVKDVFSVCLRDSGGLLALGGIGSWYSGALQYTPIIKEYFYNIKVLDVLVGGVSIGISSSVYTSGECIVDSGTVMPTLPPIAFKALRKTFESHCTDLIGICKDVKASNETLFDQTCYQMSSSDIGKFPIIQFVLAGMKEGETMKLDYPPSLYLRYQYFCESSGMVGLGVDFEKGFTIIGAELMRGYVTVFDRVNKVIGFAPVSSCNT